MYILWRRMYSTSSRLALAYSSGSSHRLYCHPMTPFPQAEQFLLIVVHEFPRFIFRSHERSRVSSLHLLFSSSVPASSTPACPLPLLGQINVLMFLCVPFSRLCCLHQHEHVDACPCTFFEFAFQLVVGDRCVDKSWSFITAHPHVHRSATLVLAPGTVILVTHEAATARLLRFVQLTQEFLVVFVLFLTSPFLTCVRSNGDIGLTASEDVSLFFTCTSR